MNAKSASEPLETLSQTLLAVERNPEALSQVLPALRPFPNDRVSPWGGERESEAARARLGIRNRSESGTLWVRPWGSK